jgi:hypothetical protein
LILIGFSSRLFEETGYPADLTKFAKLSKLLQRARHQYATAFNIKTQASRYKLVRTNLTSIRPCHLSELRQHKLREKFKHNFCSFKFVELFGIEVDDAGLFSSNGRDWDHRNTKVGKAGMSDGLSLSIFTVEVDHRPVVAFRCRKHSEAEAISADERVRAELSSISSGGKPLCNALSVIRVRLARTAERAIYGEQTASTSSAASLTMVYLVDLDDKT